MSLNDIEKKVRKEIRLKNLIKKGDVLELPIDNSPASVMLRHIIPEIIKDPLITYGKGKKVLSDTMEDISKKFLCEYIEDTEITTEGIMPLAKVTKDECKIYCDKLKLKYILEVKKDVIDEIIDEFKVRHPQTMHSIIKTKEILKDEK